MQTSNRDNPVENNIAEMINTIEKLSVRLPFAFSKESIVHDAVELQNLKDSIKILNNFTENL